MQNDSSAPCACGCGTTDTARLFWSSRVGGRLRVCAAEYARVHRCPAPVLARVQRRAAEQIEFDRIMSAMNVRFGGR